MYEVTIRRNREAQERLKLNAIRMRELIRPAHTVLPLAATVHEMTRVFLEYPVKHIYVIDDAQRFQGSVALKDITSDLLEKHDTSVRCAADYLRSDFDAVTPDMSLATALQYFMAFQGERLPVVESRTQPILLGVVYKSSLLDAYCRMSSPG